MIERLAKVIHWTGFIVFTILYIYILYQLFLYEFKYDSYYFTENEFLGALVFAILLFVISWILKYILSGSVSLTPLEDKEITKIYYKFLGYSILFYLWIILVNYVFSFFIVSPK